MHKRLIAAPLMLNESGHEFIVHPVRPMGAACEGHAYRLSDKYHDASHMFVLGIPVVLLNAGLPCSNVSFKGHCDPRRQTPARQRSWRPELPTPAAQPAARPAAHTGSGLEITVFFQTRTAYGCS